MAILRAKDGCLFTIRASPTNVPTATAIIKRKISWYALNFVRGTMAIPINPHIDITVIDTNAIIHAANIKDNT